LNNHVVIKSKVYLDNGNQIRLPVIVVNSQGILKSYLEYLIEHKLKSPSWIDASTQAICLFLEYVDAKQHLYDKPFHLFQSFSEALFVGTTDEDGNDKSDLRWLCRDIKNANKIIGYVTQYTDWLSVKLNNSKLQLNPFKEATSYEQKLNWAAYIHRKSRAFLAHTWNNESAQKINSLSRHVKNRIAPQVDNSVKPAFPEDKINELLDNFINYKYKYHYSILKKFIYRDILLTILLNFGGLRRSEPFHIWIEDVMPHPEDSEEALVRIYHPSLSVPPKSIIYNQDFNRGEILRHKYKLKPRNEYDRSKKIHAGWKDPRLDHKDKYFVVNWFEPSAGKAFLFYWTLYLKYQRITPKKSHDHPFAFTNKFGAPYSIDAYEKQHIKAVESIGLDVAKELGTTPHAHRHAYGRRLTDAKIQGLMITKAMSHKSEESKEVYQKYSIDEIRDAMKSVDVNNRLIEHTDDED